MPNSKNAFAAVPVQDELTVGAVATAPLGTAMPANARAALSSAWTPSGFVTDDGLTFTQDRSTTKVKDWSGSTIRSLFDEFSPTVQFSEAETSPVTMKRMVGENNVTVTEATAEHGLQMKVNIGPELPPAQAWCFSMKDENRRLRLLVPNGQVTAVDSVSFVRNDIVKWSFTIEANADEYGNSMYLLTDDGEVVAVTVPDITLDHSNVSVKVGKTFPLHVTTNPANAEVTWESSDTDKALVTNGVIAGVAAGSVTITASITVDETEYTDTCAVTVEAAS